MMKMPFKQTKLAAAMLIAVGTGLASTTSVAVNLSDNGLGDVGVIPYYTVRSSFDTYVSVVNTSDDYTVAFKIRFRESDNSRDARDFNVFLSPNDVWTAVVTMGTDGETPVLMTADNTCTAPALQSREAQPLLTSDTMLGVAFTNIGYAGGSQFFEPDAGSESIERAQEGYIEVIEMGVARPDASALARAAVHGANGIPADCAAISTTYLEQGNQPFVDQFDEPLNVLKVDSYMLRVDQGVGTGIPVTMLANFYNPNGVEDPEQPAPADIMFAPDRDQPNLADALPASSSQVVEVLGAINDDGFDPGPDAVSSLMTATSVINEYAIGGAALAMNDWVVTFPTKNFYVDTANTPDAPINPFQQPFSAQGSCVDVAFNYFDREERTTGPGPDFCDEFPDAPQCNLNFSPRPDNDPVPVDPTAQICWEVQTLSFAEEPVLGSGNNYGVPLMDSFTSGWMNLRFPRTQPGAADPVTPIQGTYTYYGLPTIGFSVKTLENGVASTLGVLNYAVAAPHAYARTVAE